MQNNPLHQKRAGVLLHPTSLPSGKLDADVDRWLAWMQKCGFSIWQMLPLVSPDQTGSPYQSNSAFALNPDFLELRSEPEKKDLPAINIFIHEQLAWLPDYALFMTLKQHFKQQPWSMWPEAYRNRHHNELLQFRKQHAAEIEKIVWQQFQLHERWNEIHQAARDKGIYLFGDMPIFVAYDSADVWANSGQFLLDENLQPTYVAGVPPDYFSEKGQRWGNPQYNWEVMQQDQFSWWQSRIRHMLQLFDIIRIDHFRGLEACWMIPAEEETAINGFWQETPGDELLHALQEHIADLPIVAEDLGEITPGVTALRDKYELPGMSVLQFAFDAFDDNPHKPKNFTPNTVAYTGTHDNNTTAGWFNELQPHEKDFVFEILETDYRDDIANCLVETALYSNANTAIAPLQDLLQLDTKSRMNTPGETDNNWKWQFDWNQLNDEICSRVKQHIKQSGRLHEK